MTHVQGHHGQFSEWYYKHKTYTLNILFQTIIQIGVLTKLRNTFRNIYCLRQSVLTSCELAPWRKSKTFANNRQFHPFCCQTHVRSPFPIIKRFKSQLPKIMVPLTKLTVLLPLIIHNLETALNNHANRHYRSLDRWRKINIKISNNRVNGNHVKHGFIQRFRTGCLQRLQRLCATVWASSLPFINMSINLLNF